MLPAFLEAADDGLVAHPFLEAIKAGTEIVFQPHYQSGPQECFLVVDHAALQHGVAHLHACKVAVDADVLRLLGRRYIILIKGLIKGEGREDADYHQEKQYE